MDTPQIVNIDQLADTILEASSLVSIPVVGTIGGSACERACCSLAHQAARGQMALRDQDRGTPFWLPTPVKRCDHLRYPMCELTSYAYPCLFAAPDDPIWELIRNSIKLEGVPEPTP